MRFTVNRKFYNNPKFWIFFIIVFNCIYKAMINYLKFPELINYFNDVACLILLIFLIQKNKDGKLFKLTRTAGTSVFLLLIISFISYMLNLYNPMVLVWGIRTLFRFLIFYLACICYCDKKMIDKIMKFLFYLLIVNTILVTFQYNTGYSLDSVTGLFSISHQVAGGSAGMNMLMCIASVYSIISYMNKESSLYSMGLSLIMCIYISALAEIKVFYFELVLIILLVAIITKLSFKKIVGICVLGLVLFMGVNLYNQYYGNEYYYTSRGISFFSMEAFVEYIGVDGSSYGRFNSLNRMTAMPYVWNNFLITFPKRLFGLGVGYGDTVSSSMFSSGFLAENTGLGYQLWTVSLELTNIGLVGLLVCFSFYVGSYFECEKSKKIVKGCDSLIQTSQICSVLFVILLFYNQSFILDIAAPLMFFIMAIPYALINTQMDIGGSRL